MAGRHTPHYSMRNCAALVACPSAESLTTNSIGSRHQVRDRQFERDRNRAIAGFGEGAQIDFAGIPSRPVVLRVEQCAYATAAISQTNRPRRTVRDAQAYLNKMLGERDCGRKLSSIEANPQLIPGPSARTLCEAAVAHEEPQGLRRSAAPLRAFRTWPETPSPRSTFKPSIEICSSGTCRPARSVTPTRSYGRPWS